MRYVNYLGYAALPFAFLVHYWIGHAKSWEPTVTFLLAALAVIPLAHLMGEATEHLAERTGPTWGGLLNATFGNAAELIIAVIAISKGLNPIVKASLTGSILGNPLLGAGAVAELLVGAAERMAQTLGWNHIFVGVILLAIIGNAAEHSTALLLARRNDMDTAMTISFQSSIQIALFATPFLVLLSILMLRLNFIRPEHGAPQPLDLIFSPMEVVGVLLSVMIVVIVCLNGQSNWFEGVLLLAVYGILGITFFYI